MAGWHVVRTSLFQANPDLQWRSICTIKKSPNLGITKKKLLQDRQKNSEVKFPWSCPAPTDLWAPLTNQNNNPQAPPVSFVFFVSNRERTYGTQGQRSLWARDCEMAPHASQDQLLTLLLERRLQRDVTSQQQLAASSEVVRSRGLPEADDPSLLLPHLSPRPLNFD